MNLIRYILSYFRSLLSSPRLSTLDSRPLSRLSDEERMMAFSVGIDDEPLWWRGLQELLYDAEADQIDLVSAATVADKPGLLAHCAGGLDMIRTVRQELERRRQEAIRPR
jgi:hypothetical protein